MYKAYGTDMEGLWQKYEREKRLHQETGEELERTKHELIVIKNDVIDFASFFEEDNQRFNRNRPFHKIWKEFKDRVEEKFLEASRLKDQNQKLKNELTTRRNPSSLHLDDRILR